MAQTSQTTRWRRRRLWVLLMLPVFAVGYLLVWQRLTSLPLPGGQRVTHIRASYCLSPQWSPDGSQLAVTVAPRGPEGPGGATMGEAVRRMLPGRLEAPPADAQAAIVSVADKRVRTLGRGWGPAWTPEGDRLVRLRAAGETTLAGGHRQAQFVMEKAAGGELTGVRFPPPDVYAEWSMSPDGQLLAYVCFGHLDASRVGVTDLASGKDEQVEASKIVLPRILGWSPDSKDLYYMPAGGVNRWNRAKRRVSQVVKGFGVGNMGSISPKGDRLVVAGKLRRTAGGMEWWTQVVETASGKAKDVARVVDGRVTEAIWQPGGEWIAYVGEVEEGWRVEAVRSDGTGQRTLARSRSSIHGLAWSPDGKRLACVVGGPLYREEHPHGYQPDGQVWLLRTPGPTLR